MVNNEESQLDLVFGALADATRRAVLAQLGDGGSSVSELAQSHAMSLPGFMKHLAVLEAAGLIARAKEGRVVRCELDAAPMQEAAMWMARYERFWNRRFDALDRYLDRQEDPSPCPPPQSNRKSNSSNPRSSASAAASGPRPRRSGAPGPKQRR